MSTDVWEYRDDLERLAKYLCRHPEDAEDVAHTALIKAAEKLDTFRGESSVRTWLHTIATNECRMLRRKKQPTSLDNYLDSWVDGRESLGESPDPEDLAVELETREEVLAGLESLPSNYRCALLLKDGQGLSVADIARLMDSTEASVRSSLYRARRMLRDKIASDPV